MEAGPDPRGAAFGAGLIHLRPGLLHDLSPGRVFALQKFREFYDEYFAVLDMAESFYLDTLRKVFFEHHIPKGIMEFRNHSYRSVITGTMAPPHHTPWKDALDDSLESYLGAKETTAAAE